MKKEIYKPIPGYEFYEVSNLSNIKSVSRIIRGKFKSEERILKQNKMSTGYLCVALSKDQKRKTHLVHQLVAMAFLSHKPNGNRKGAIVVDHIDNNKLNNRLENLQLLTVTENLRKN